MAVRLAQAATLPIQVPSHALHVRRGDTRLRTLLSLICRRSVVDYLVFGLLVGLYLLPFMRIVLPHSNEGSLLSGAERIAHGDVFARDFFEVMGPGSFYILALFFRVFGISLFAARAWLFCSSLGIASCVYFLARRVCPRNPILPCLVLGGTWFGMQWPSASHHIDSDLFALLSVVCLVIWEERRNSLAQYASGLCAGLTVWIHQPKGALLILALLSWCLCTRFPGTKRSASCIRVLLGFLAVSGIACAYFVSRGALGSLWYANVIWPAHNYGAVNNVPYALGIFNQYWRHWAVLQGGPVGWSIVLASTLIIPFVFVALIPALLLVAASILRLRSITPPTMLCVLCGWSMWLSEIHRMDIYHLAFGCPLLLLVAIFLVSNLRAARPILHLLAISATCLLIVNLLQVSTARTISTRVGSVSVLRPEPLLSFLDTHTQPHQEIFCYPSCPGYYFLTATRNPTRFSILIYNYNTRAEFQEAVRALETRHVKLVIWDSSFGDRTWKAIFPGLEPMPASQQVMEPYLRARYKQIADLEGFRVLLRNE